MSSVVCGFCGKDHPAQESEKAYRLPDDVFAIGEDERESRCRIAKHFCQFDERIFVRGLIPVPIHGTDRLYCWGVWAETSWPTYSEIFDTWDSEDPSDLEVLEGRLANSLPAYTGTIGLRLQIVRKADTRPFFYVIDDHQLGKDQINGIGAEMPVRYAHL